MTVLVAATMANVVIAGKPRESWSKKKATKWYKEHDWQRGSNFIPGYAIDPLEMWQHSLWFHDIFRKDGTPYSTEEVTLIKSLTGAQ